MIAKGYSMDSMGEGSPRTVESRPEEMRIKGGSPEQRQLVQDICRKSRLPLDNVRTVRLTKNGVYERLILGDSPKDAGSYTFATKTLTLNLALFDGPRRELETTVIHELAHANTPFKRNDSRYGGAKNRLEIKSEIQKIVKALKSADILLTTYHVELSGRNKLLRLLHPFKSLSNRILEEEVWAILVELRYTDPDELVIAERGLAFATQKRIFKRRAAPRILTRNNSDHSEGIDKALLALMPQLQGIEDLDQVTKDFCHPRALEPVHRKRILKRRNVQRDWHQLEIS